MTSRRAQRDAKPSDAEDHSFSALERELHEKQPDPNRRQRRSAARSEADSIARVTPKHLRSRPMGEAS